MNPTTDFFGGSVEGLQTGFQVYALCIVVLAGIFLRRGELPPQVSSMLRATALLWIGAYAWMLWDMLPSLPRHEIFLLGVFPSLCLFVVPEFAEILMHGFYGLFDWPTPLQKVALEQRRRQLDVSFRSRRRPLAQEERFRRMEKEISHQSPSWIVPPS